MYGPDLDIKIEYLYFGNCSHFCSYMPLYFEEMSLFYPFFLILSFFFYVAEMIAMGPLLAASSLFFEAQSLTN